MFFTNTRPEISTLLVFLNMLNWLFYFILCLVKIILHYFLCLVKVILCLVKIFLYVFCV